MSYIQVNWSAPSHIKAFTTTRSGGCSQGVYHSMNLSHYVGDERQNVQSNRQQLRSDLELKTEPVWLEQVHSNQLANADLQIRSAVDGSFSTTQNTVCVVMTADCMPILLTNRAGDQVAAVHAGWRGMAAGIIENAVALFQCPRHEIIAWAGPCIGPTKFEIGTEVRDQIGGSDNCYKPSKNNKLLANLYLLCEQRLSALGVSNYSHSEACTYSDNDQFFSYRRDGQCGRMASLIWIGNE